MFNGNMWRGAILGMVALAAAAAVGIARAQTPTGAAAPAPAAALPVIKGELTDDWKPLFNGKNLDGFYTFLDKSGKNKDPKGIFKVKDEMLLIMDLPAAAATPGVPVVPEETGYLCTEKTYGDFEIRFEYKWGTKRWAPRATQVRDSGCHYLLTGPDHVWASCVECQVEEGDTGDAYLLNNGYKAETTVKSATDSAKTFMPASAGGVPYTMTGGRLIHSERADSATDWNTVQVIVKGNSSTQIVNGKTVMQLNNICLKSDGTPVKEGRIAFQSEAAEMFYRKIEIRKAK